MAKTCRCGGESSVYQRVPMESDLVLAAGERRGFLIHTSCPVGVANRWPVGASFQVGEETDADDCVRIFAMRAQPEPEPFGQEVDEPLVHPCTGEVCGETACEERSFHGHAFVGEIEYQLLESLAAEQDTAEEELDGCGAGGGAAGKAEKQAAAGKAAAPKMLAKMKGVKAKVQQAMQDAKAGGGGEEEAAARGRPDLGHGNGRGGPERERSPGGGRAGGESISIAEAGSREASPAGRSRAIRTKPPRKHD